MKERIGILGGSFDPIHIGHLNLAREMMEKRHLDQVWFCPTSSNPLKNRSTKAGAEDRLRMVALAIQEEPRFGLMDIEAYMPSPCYTVDTLRKVHRDLKEEGINREYFFIIGDDSAATFHQWKEPETIITLATLLVGTRETNGAKPHFRGSEEVVKALENGITPTKVLCVSSTEIRRRLEAGEDCSELLPAKVLDYILSNQLYSIPASSK